MAESTVAETEKVAKHSPGPWRIRIDEREVRITPEDFGLAFILRPHRRGSHRGEKAVWNKFNEREIANAKLAAAAPELLEAVRHAEAAFQNIDSVMRQAIERGATMFNISDLRKALQQYAPTLRDVIAKATGR